jgi:polar amino acid transport system substrate-binding protein
MVMRRLALGLLVLTAGLLPPTGATAEPGPPAVTLAVPVSMQPYFIPHRQTGLTYDVVREAFAARGRKVQPVYVSPRNNRVVLSRDAGVDCAALLDESGRAKWPAVLEVHPFQDHAITLTATGLTLDRIEDLRDKTLVAFGGASRVLGPAFQAVAHDNPRYREVGNHRAQLRLLLSGRVEVVVADKRLVEWYLEYLRDYEKDQHDGQLSVTYHNLFDPVDYYFGCRRREILDEFQAGLESIRDNGKLARIRAHYEVPSVADTVSGDEAGTP